MLTQDQIQRIVAKVQNFDNSMAVLLPALHILAENNNRIDQDDVDYLSQMLELHSREIWGVISFYDCFNYRKESTYIFKVCSGVCCSINKSYEILEDLKKKLNIEVGETTPDGLFSLQNVDCLGHCAETPVLQVNNDKCYTEMTPEKTSDLLKKLRDQAEEAE